MWRVEIGQLPSSRGAAPFPDLILLYQSFPGYPGYSVENNMILKSTLWKLSCSNFQRDKSCIVMGTPQKHSYIKVKNFDQILTNFEF